MRIGFDAYFAFHYKTGVAHYSRNLINSLAKRYPEMELVLFTDRTSTLYQPSACNISVVELGCEVDYYNWLSNADLLPAIENERLDIFHGLDHGLPALRHTKKVVTIHDLFFETHPQLYSGADVKYYCAIAQKASQEADIVISISEFTKSELVDRYHIGADKISVCYQSCNPLFFQRVTSARKLELRKQFDLPEKFWLYVGSIIERKNLLNICRALNEIKTESTLPLMVIGEGGAYLQEIKEYVKANGLNDRVRFLSYTNAAKHSISFQQAKDVPALYQMALALIYPSELEGFGIPLLEAFASGLPVITSNTSSLPEIGGDAAMYVNPYNVDEIAGGLLRLEKDEDLRHSMIEKGKHTVQYFTEEKAAAAVMKVYQQLL